MIQEEHRYNPLDGDRYAAAHTQASPALRSEALRVTVPHTLVLFCFVFLPLSPIGSFEKLVALSMSCWVRFWWPSEAGKMKR